MKPIVTGSLDTGPVQDASVVGRAVKAPAGPVAGEEPLSCSGWLSENAPLTRWPGAVVEASATVRVASPAVEITLAVVDAE